MKRLSAFLIAACLLLPGTAAFAQTKIYPAPTRFSATIAPATNDGAALGTTDLGWSDVHLATGGGINWANGEITLIGAPDTLTLAGGALAVPSNDSEGSPAIYGAGSTTGIRFNTAGSRVLFDASGTQQLAVSSGFLYIATGTILGFGGGDTEFGREAANILQQGPDADVAVAQIFKGPDGSGTDKAGGDMTYACGRGTGTALGGNCYIATAPAGAASNSTQNALVNRVAVGPTGVVGFSPQDVAATPIEPTTTLKMFAYNKSVADDGIVTLPAVTSNAYGVVSTNNGATYTHFTVSATGTVTLFNNTADVVANADTDVKVDVGTAASQEPLQVKNRLGSTQVLNILFWYD